MLSQYIQAAMRQAKYEILSDDRSFYGEIPDFQGVYVNAETLENCREELAEAPILTYNGFSSIKIALRFNSLAAS
ncbi:MAG TPA: hypothetical protein VGP58_01265, partial [Pyrinomonadaceae bacterium]|nr:hypothetical protein [Pyrinomonadaceae bacterium]